MKEKKMKAKALVTELEMIAEDMGTDLMDLIHECTEKEGEEYGEAEKPSNKAEMEMNDKKVLALAKAKKYGA